MSECDHQHDHSDHMCTYHNEGEKSPRIAFVPSDFAATAPGHAIVFEEEVPPYVIQSPLKSLEDPEAFSSVLLDIAHIARTKIVDLYLPEAWARFAQEIQKRLALPGLKVKYKNHFDTEMEKINHGTELRFGALCVDQRVTRPVPDRVMEENADTIKRLHRMGMVSSTETMPSRLRHPASILYWHDDALEILDRTNPLHARYIRQQIQMVIDSNGLIDTMISHVGLGEEKGCGGIAYLNSLARQINGEDFVSNVTELVRKFIEIRDKYRQLMTTNPVIKLDLIGIVEEGGEKTRVCERFSLDQLERGKGGIITHPLGMNI